MNRETGIAVTLGIIIGLAVGLVVLLKSPQEDNTKIIPVNQQRSGAKPVQIKVDKDTVLTITSPVQQLVTTVEEIPLVGKAPAKSLIVAQSANGRAVMKTTSDAFTLAFPLSLGENVIHVSSYGTTGSPQEAVITIYRIEE